MVGVWHPFDSHRNLLRRALNRLTEVHFDPATTEEDALGALTDWMQRLLRIDDVLAASLGRRPYEATRKVSPASQAVLGVKHAWNLTKHHSHRLESVVRISYGRAYPRVYPSLYREVVWLPFAALPLPEPRYRNPDQEQAYRDYLADTPVRVLAASMTDHLCELGVQVSEGKKDG